MRTGRRWLVAALLALLAAGVPAAAWAQDPAEGPVVISFEQQDLDQDGAPDLATITADYMGDRYRVLVYDQGRDMGWSGDWEAGTDFANDVWLFQSEGGGQTRLILRFSQGPEGYRAELYDDVDGDGGVRHQVRDGTGIEILESSYPTLDVTASRPWVLPDGRVNDIVCFTTYRPWSVPWMQSAGVSHLPQDGRPTYIQEVVDGDGNGIADYQLSLALPDLPQGWRVFRSMISANVSQYALPDVGGGFFWPYLNDSRRQAGGSLQARAAPIVIDWQAGRLQHIGSLMSGWGWGDRWFVLSSRPIEKGAVNELDWETFAYYDFSGDAVMDVLMRLVHYSFEPVRAGSAELHPQLVSYAWHRQDRDTIHWDYELELAALRELPSSVIQFRDFAVYAVPYGELLDHYSHYSDWAYATFVAAESDAYQSNEGIWEWGALGGTITDVSLPPAERIVPGSYQAQYGYLYGTADDSPAAFYTQIREGFRGEYADLAGPARLYFGALDRRLHLAKAQTGVWNLGDGREIRYGNLGGDYLDTWTLLADGEPTMALYAPPGYLIYQDPAGVQLFRANGPAALFETGPPRDEAEWRDLDDRVALNRIDFAPDDLLAMARQTGEHQSAIRGASIRDLRLAGDGFRFVLALRPGFALSGRDPLGLETLPAGKYVVTLSAGLFSVQPLTATRVTLGLEVGRSEESLQVLHARVENKGLADLPGLRLSIARNCDGPAQQVGEYLIDLYGQGSRTVSALLPPAGDRACTVEVKVLDLDDAELAAGQVLVAPAEGAAGLAGRILAASGGRGVPLVLFVLLGLVVAFAGLLATALLRRGSL